MSEINNERQSAPTGAQTSELEQEANHPLGVASCSESSLYSDRMYQICLGVRAHMAGYREMYAEYYKDVIENHDGEGSENHPKNIIARKHLDEVGRLCNEGINLKSNLQVA